MKKTKDVLNFISKEDALEFKRMATGRRFCKKGERIIDICLEELKRYEYENSRNLFMKIFKPRCIKKNKEKLMIENRMSSNKREKERNYIEE